MSGDRARTELADSRFCDVRWVPETRSTNADALARAYQGVAEGLVVVADHQTAGRGRRGRTWEAPAGASLLMSVLLRPPARVLGATTMAAGLAAAEAIEEVAGFAPLLKWPNDLVCAPAVSVSGGRLAGGTDRPVADRKLAGILAEAEWPVGIDIAAGWRDPPVNQRAVVAVGIGINVNWPAELPAELADTAVAANQLAGHDIDREDLLIALLRRLDEHYGELLSDGSAAGLLGAWRARSATLGRRVRIDLGSSDVEGTAVDVTSEGHLVVETLAGHTRTFAVGDVVHLR